MNQETEIMNKSYSIFDISKNTIPFSDLKFSKSRSKSGRRFILSYYDKKPILLKFPRLRIPFDSKLNKFNQLEINVSLGNNVTIIDKIKALDICMVEFALEHNWFSGEFDYVPTLKESKNRSFPPTIKFKIPIKDSVIKTKFFDNNQQSINIGCTKEIEDLCTKGTEIFSAIECIGVWFSEDNRFGLTWTGVQVRVMDQEPDPEDLFDSDLEDVSDVEFLVDDDE